MKSGKPFISFYLSFLFAIMILTGCNAIGMLLFYRESKTTIVYRSSNSKKNFFTIKATTLSHCGCTDLYVENYKNGKKEFYIFYNDNRSGKIIFRNNTQTNQRDTLRLIATPYGNYAIAFDSLDSEIYNRIDSILVQKPKGIVYQVKRTKYKGFISDPYYNR